MKRSVTQPPESVARELPNLLSVDQVAALLRRHPEVVRRQARDGRLPAEKIGRVWFFQPQRLAEAGFRQFSGASTKPAGTVSDRAQTSSLLKALSEAGLQALQRPDRNAIFQAIGSRLGEVGLSTFFFDRTPDGRGLTVAFRFAIGAASDLATVTGAEEPGRFLPFERIPVLHQVCTTRRPHYLGDREDLVRRVGVALKLGNESHARQISEMLDMHGVVSAPLVVGDETIGALTVIGPALQEADVPAVMAFANQTAAALEAARLLAESRNMEEAAVLMLADAVELRDALHSRARQHAELAERFARYLGFDATRCRRVRYAALLLDLGKLSLPDSILKNRGRLDSEERALMMTHPVVAADLVARFKPLADLAPLLRSHHESFDGDGYPDGLRGEAIPIETRLISVVNAFFGVTFDISHKTEKTVDEGLQELSHFGGISLDAKLVEAFLAMFREARSANADWHAALLQAVLISVPATPAGPKDLLSVADSRELRIIYRIAQEMTAVLDLSTLLTRIVNIICDVMGYYMASILLPGDKPKELRVGAHSGYQADITGVTIPAGEGITGWVFQHGIPQIVADVRKDPRYIRFDENVHSELAFPLISRGQVVGVLNAESEQVDAFSEADVGLMSAVGSQLASVLEVAQLHDTLKREASHDPLTRLYNRRLFLERIGQEIARAQAAGESFSIVFLDVNDLKRINDTYGHLAGDALLREVSNALMDAVRGEDVVARYGGDEFIVLLPATGATAAVSVAQRISDGIARHRFMAGRDLLEIPGVSLGVATFPQDGSSAEELLGAADATLYRQKRKAS